MPTPPNRSRWWRRVARAVSWSGLSLVGLVLLAIASLQLSLVRTQISEVTSRQLSQLFHGDVEVTIDESLGVFGVSGLNVRVSTQDGTPVAVLSRVDAELKTLKLLSSLFQDGPVQVNISEVSVGEAWVELTTNEQGQLRLVEALTPQGSAEPTSSGGPAPRITFDTIELNQTRVVLGTEALDSVWVEQLTARLEIQDTVRLQLQNAEVRLKVPNVEGTFDGELTGELLVTERGVPTAEAATVGSVGGVKLTALSTLHGDVWSSIGELRGGATAWRELDLGVAPSEHITIEFEALGDFTAAHVSVTAHDQSSEGGRRASAALNGALAVVSDLQFEPFDLQAGIAATNVDPHAFASASPRGDVSFDGTARVEINSPLRAEVSLSAEGGQFAGSPFPSFDTHISLSDARSIEVEVRTTDAPRVELRGAATRSDGFIDFEAVGSASGIPPELPVDGAKEWAISGLEFAAEGKYHVESSRLSASGKLTVDRVTSRAAGISARGVQVDVASDGPLSNPQLSGRARARSLEVSDLSASQVSVNLRPVAGGSFLDARARVLLDASEPNPLDVGVAARLTGMSPLDVRDVRLDVSRDLGRGPTRMSASVDRVRVAERIAIEGLRASGVGEVAADLEIAGADVSGDVRVQSLDLARLSGLFTPLAPELAGLVTADVAADVQRGQVVSGHVYGRATDTRTKQFELEQFDASLVIKEAAVSGSAQLRHRDSWVRLDTLRAKSSPSAISGGDPQSVIDALHGYFALSVDADASDFEELLAGMLPEVEVQGHLDGEARVLKGAGAELDADWALHVRDLDFRRLSDASAGKDSEHVAASEAWSVRELSAEWVGSYHGASGNLSSGLRIESTEHERPLAWLSLSTDVEPNVLLHGDLARLQTTPLSGVLIVPEVKLSELPSGQLLQGVRASVEARVEIGGTPVDPELDGTLNLTDFSVESLERSLPVTLRVAGAYRQSKVDAQAKVWHQQRLVGEVRLSGELGEDRQLVGKAQLSSIPLQCFPYVRDYGLDGIVTGRLDYTRNTGRESLFVDVRGRDLLAAGVRVRQADVNVEFDGGEFSAEAKLEQPEGRVELTLRGAANDSRLASLQPRELVVSAETFQVRPVFALVRQPVADVEGIVDGEMRLNLSREELSASGNLSLREGGFHMVSLGEAVRDLRFELSAQGREMRLTELSAKLGEGSLDGEGQAKYGADGGFEGRAEFKIPESEPVPISREGLTVAHASGRVDLVASRDPKLGVKVGLDVPRLRVEIEPGSGRSVQDIEPAQTITLGSTTSAGRFVAYRQEVSDSTTDAEPIELSIELGDDVWVYRGAGTFAAVNGKVRVLLSDEVRVHGELNAGEGQIDIMGRVFEVRQGTIALHGETPPDPDIVAEAAWESPSGHTIIAAFRGALRSGELTLRSEPALSYDGILNVILFDDPEGVGAEEGEGSAPASGVAASIAGAGLGRALSDLTELDVSAGVDTSDQAAPRPELGVRLSPRVAVGVAYNPDPAPSLGRAPDRAIVSLDWRLSHRWTLESSFGDRGSATTDLVWRLRY